MYADYDPEDAYDAGDSVVEILRNLIARLTVIRDRETDSDLRDRADRIRDDLGYVRSRVFARDRLDDA